MSPSAKLILGTVQFGLDYGINNASGKPGLETVFDILNLARKAGVKLLDTASVYGDAEERLGAYFSSEPDANTFQVITKLHPSSDHNWEDSLESSFKLLNRQALFGLLFHSYKDFLANKEILPAVKKLQEQGRIQHLGVSVYTNAEIEELLQEPAVEIIQLPFNLLDNDTRRGALLRRARAAGKIIHTRSAFLQGLFFKPLDQLSDTLKLLRPALERINDIAHEAQVSVATLALQYAISQPYIDGVLIGVDSLAQLQMNLQGLERPIDPIAFEEVHKITLPDSKLLNPSLW